MPSPDVAGSASTAPRDPTAFYAEVLRRAGRIERRRRRLRAVAWALGVLTLVSTTAVLATRPRSPSVPFAPAAQPAARITTFAPAGDGVPWAVVGAGDGSVWYTERPAQPGGRGAVSRIDPAGHTVRYELPPGSTPGGIVASTDGGFWYSDPGRRLVGRVSIDGTVSESKTPARPGEALVYAADDAVWFLEPDVDRVAKITADGHITEYPLPAGRRPAGLAAFGGAVWFGEAGVAKLGRMSTTGSITEVDLPDPAERVTDVAAGPGPAVWYVATAGEGDVRLGRFAGDGRLRERRLDNATPPGDLTLGPDGRLWLAGAETTTLLRASATDLGTQRLGRPLGADALATGADGSLWTVDRDARLIARIDLP